MPEVTFPNQRLVKVHRESAKADFLGIKNENWQAASRDLGAHALLLYLYFAANADNYTLALSPVAVRQAIGMARSTYHDQFSKLVDKGYLVPTHGNTYDFFEVPQPRHGEHQENIKNSVTPAGYDFEKCTADELPQPQTDNIVLAEDIEINNTDNSINSVINREKEEVPIVVPKVREITIPVPTAEGRNRPKYIPQPPKAEFVF